MENVNKKAIIGTVILIVVVLGGWFVYEMMSKKDSPAPTNTNTTTQTNTENKPGENTAQDTSTGYGTSTATTTDSFVDDSTSDIATNIKEFTVTGANFSFTPSSITVNQGDRVKIIFKNKDGFHDLKIDNFNVATQRINGGQEDAVEFTADRVGVFEYYCSVGTHKTMGMKGNLIVQGLSK